MQYYRILRYLYILWVILLHCNNLKCRMRESNYILFCSCFYSQWQRFEVNLCDESVPYSSETQIIYNSFCKSTFKKETYQSRHSTLHSNLIKQNKLIIKNLFRAKLETKYLQLRASLKLGKVVTRKDFFRWLCTKEYKLLWKVKISLTFKGGQNNRA